MFRDFSIFGIGLSGTGFKDLSERMKDLVDQRSSKVLGRFGTPSTIPYFAF
jgi:hypothetical protein